MKTGLAALVCCLCVCLCGCTPSVNVNVNLAPIYAKLDVNVKVQLDNDLKSLVQQNPNLF